jgi:hypothetical protein
MPLRENHCANPATSAMKMAPSLTPKMKRPITMRSYGVPIAVSTAPSTPMAADQSAMRAGP